MIAVTGQAPDRADQLARGCRITEFVNEFHAFTP
jgi:hypothetical protein